MLKKTGWRPPTGLPVAQRAYRSARATVVLSVRNGLRRMAAHTWSRAFLQIAIGELSAAVKDTVDEARYGSAYFGRSRPKYMPSGGVISGYARYDRRTSNMNLAAYLVWRFLPGGQVLDVGAALGFLVEAFRDIGVDAVGLEFSKDAVRNATPGAAGHILQGDALVELPFRDGYADIVTCLETLEHLPPDAIPAVAAELRRVCRGFLFVTTPSFGTNLNGPDGFLERKVRDEVLGDYYGKGPEYGGPVPYADLYRDADGNPVEGHLTAASYAWWTTRFEEAGFVRCGATERLIHPQIHRFGMATLWNLYVFRVPPLQEPVGEIHDADACRAVERLFRLKERPQPAPPTPQTHACPEH